MASSRATSQEDGRRSSNPRDHRRPARSSVRLVPLSPGIVQPVAPSVPGSARAGPVPPKATPPRPGRAPGPILPPRPTPIQPQAVGATARPAHAVMPPVPTLPSASRPAALQPSVNNAFAVPATFALKPSILGQRLPEAVRQKMEAIFQADFSQVRVHEGSEATSLGALAFAHGSDLYFAPGHYNPQTPQGQRLLGHELTHVVQQRAGRVRNPLGSGIAIVQDPALEAEAERMGLRAATVPPAPVVQPRSLPSPAPSRGAILTARPGPALGRATPIVGRPSVCCPAPQNPPIGVAQRRTRPRGPQCAALETRRLQEGIEGGRDAGEVRQRPQDRRYAQGKAVGRPPIFPNLQE